MQRRIERHSGLEFAGKAVNEGGGKIMAIMGYPALMLPELREIAVENLLASDVVAEVQGSSRKGRAALKVRAYFIACERARFK